MEKSNRLLEKIREENIQPIPKWYFQGKNLLIWSGFVLSVFVGAAAFSIILFSIQQTDFSLLAHLNHSRVEFLLGLLPFFWIILLLVFLALATLSVYYSNRGYKFHRRGLVLISVGFSILLGTFFFMAGGSGKLEQVFDTNLSAYESIQEKKIKIWMNPEGGFLAGRVENVRDSTFSLIDFNSKTWEISYGRAFVAPVVSLENGVQIKMIGHILGEDSFFADEIRPWGGPQRMSPEKIQQLRKK